MPLSARNIKEVRKQLEGLVPEVRKEFKKGIYTRNIKRVIIQDIIKGVSPVKGGGKFTRYSNSYKEQIRGKAAYRVINGKVVRFGKDAANDALGISTKQFRSLRPDSAARKTRASAQKKIKKLVDDLNRDFKAMQSPTKKVSPVNLRLSGALHKSLRVFSKGNIFRSFRLVVQFKNRLADIHNRLGAGKSKVIRRLLPTNPNERFNRKIEGEVISQLSLAADKVITKTNRSNTRSLPK